MTNIELRDKVAAELFVSIAHKDGRSAKDCAQFAWEFAQAFIASKPADKLATVGRSPIKPIEPNGSEC